MTDTIRTVLLDLDGTLVDSQPGIVSSCLAALKALGHDGDPEMDISFIIGPPIEDVMRHLLNPFGDDRVSDAVYAYRADYGSRGILLSQLYPGIEDALHSLYSSGVEMFLATSKLEIFATRILENVGISKLFKGVYGSIPGTGLDHKPELIAHILQANTLEPSRCAMIGDRKFDIAGAHANHVRGFGALWGYGTRNELDLAGADLLLTKPSDLEAAVFGLQGN